jgi:hypothetical protein
LERLMKDRTRTRIWPGATAEERLRFRGWTEVVRRPEIGPCWEWNGGTHGRGYGKLFDGERTVSAHRLAYSTWVGPIPDGHQVCHRCDNPPCMNPAHLFTGPLPVNVADKVSKGRSGKGDTGWQAKLTDEQVEEIRRSVTGVRGEQAALARDFGVSQATISLIVRGLHRARSDHDDRLVGSSSALV